MERKKNILRYSFLLEDIFKALLTEDKPIQFPPAAELRQQTREIRVTCTGLLKGQYHEKDYKGHVPLEKFTV